MVRFKMQGRKKELVELTAFLIKAYVLLVISFFFQSPVQAQTWSLIAVKSGLKISQMKPWANRVKNVLLPNELYHVSHFLDTEKMMIIKEQTESNTFCNL